MRAMYEPANAEGFRLKVPPLRVWPSGLNLRLPRWSTLAYLLLPLAAYAALHARANLVGKVRVRGYMVERGAAGVSALRAYSQEWPRQHVTVRAGPYAMRYTRAELGASMPTERVCARVLGLDHMGLAELDLGALWSADSRGIELPLSPVIDQTKLVMQVSELRRRVEHLPVPGMIMSDGNVLPGIPGFTIELATAVDTLANALRADELEVQLNGRSMAPPEPLRYGSETAGGFAYRMVMFETKYRTAGPAAGRAHNVEMAAAHLEGLVIPPRGELSFNAVVGERSYARGFANAKEIAARRIVDGVGGGVCQVAATLHAAAFLGGFDLPVYQPHSRPAHYIELGLDTMVSWPAQDMRIANPYPFSVRVRASARDGVLRIALEGSGKAHFVEWNTRILARVRPGTQEVLDDTLAAGESEVLQEPIDGLTVRRVRTIYLPTGPRREESMLKYPPNDRIVAVGSSSAHARPKLASSQRISRLVLDDF
jgi:vancomycin resistance protein YoaR